MNQLKKIIRDNKLMFDIINLILGIVVLILIVLYFKFKNTHVFFAFYMLCGIMNVINGIKYGIVLKKRASAISSIVVGVIIIMIGLIIQIAA